MPEEKLGCPFMSQTAIIVRDIVNLLTNPSQIPVVNKSPDGKVGIVAEQVTISVPCMKEKCALWRHVDNVCSFKNAY